MSWWNGVYGETTPTWPFHRYNYGTIMINHCISGCPILNIISSHGMAACQNLVPLVNIKIAGKWMFIPLIGIDPYPYVKIETPRISQVLNTPGPQILCWIHPIAGLYSHLAKSLPGRGPCFSSRNLDDFLDCVTNRYVWNGFPSQIRVVFLGFFEPPAEKHGWENQCRWLFHP